MPLYVQNCVKFTLSGLHILTPSMMKVKFGVQQLTNLLWHPCNAKQKNKNPTRVN